MYKVPQRPKYFYAFIVPTHFQLYTSFKEMPANRCYKQCYEFLVPFCNKPCRYVRSACQYVPS